MKENKFTNKIGKVVNYLEWKIDNPKACVVISHGMAEHPERYDDVAKFFNKNGYSVFAIYHIGHGKFAEIKGHMGKGEFDQCVTNLSELVDLVKKETNKDCFLLGHSMGSFLSQLYIERYHNIKGLILSGSSAATPLMKMGSFIAGIVNGLAKDKTAPSPFMNTMSFGSYNKAFKNPRTEYDWLNRDEREVDKYVADPLCGFVCSKSFFKGMCDGLAEMGKPSETAKVDKNLPILIHGGSMDPVSNSGAGLYALLKQYKDLGIKDVTLVVYDQARHEIYNELCKDEVYNNSVKFFDSHL